MKNYFRIVSFSYLFALSVALIIPLDLIIITNVIPEEKHPNNNASFIIHLVLFFLLYFLLYFSFTNKYKILYYSIIYSFLIEFLQIFTSRGFQFFDILFNLIGLLISFLFLMFLFKIKKS